MVEGRTVVVLDETGGRVVVVDDTGGRVVVDEDTTRVVVDETTTLVVVTCDVSLYNSNLFPAPQYWNGFPGQRKSHSVLGALVDAALRVLPQ